MPANRRWRQAATGLFALALAAGGLTLAGRALLSGGSVGTQLAGGLPIAGPTPSGIFPSVIPDDDPAGPKLTWADDFPDPALPGEEIEFNLYWEGSRGRAVQALICKTPAVSDGECAEGAWTSGRMDRHSPSLAHLTVSLEHFGANAYYAYACNDRGACSEGRAHMFRVERRPVIISAADEPDPVRVGETVSFTVEWSDPDLPNGDEAQVWICQEDGTAWGGCADASWAESEFSNTGVSTASYRTSKQDARYKPVYGDECKPGAPCVQHYWAFVCDRAGACAGSIHGTFTVLPPE